MLFAKAPEFRSKRLRTAAKDQCCIDCGHNVEGEIVLCHLPMHAIGFGGRGIKALDWLAAHLCAACHSYADGEGRRDWQWRYRVLALTLERLFSQGVIEVKGGP